MLLLAGLLVSLQYRLVHLPAGIRLALQLAQALHGCAALRAGAFDQIALLLQRADAGLDYPGFASDVANDARDCSLHLRREIGLVRRQRAHAGVSLAECRAEFPLDPLELGFPAPQLCEVRRRHHLRDRLEAVALRARGGDQLAAGLTFGEFRVGQDQLALQRDQLLIAQAGRVAREIVLRTVAGNGLLRSFEFVAQHLDPVPQPVRDADGRRPLRRQLALDVQLRRLVRDRGGLGGVGRREADADDV